MIDVLPTKLHIPPIRQSIVSRPRLLEKLNRGLDVHEGGFSGKLSLISAPAGFGKSTLVVDWITRLSQTLEVRACWLSLDEQDNSLVRLFSYLAATFQTIDPAWGQMLLGMLQAPERPPPTTLMGSLIRDVCKPPDAQPIILVIDDFHYITNRAVHDAITFLLDHQPPCLHLAIITREDPMLPLARLRARRQMVEIRLADLRFTMEETAAFLGDIKGLELDPDDVAALGARTEGWIAGLQLAALSIQQSQDAPAFIRSFTGSNRYLLDYLIEEVITRQTADIQTFLLQTSILSRFNADLCDAVTERTDSAFVLSKLLHANLFLIALDENQEWYRYHHLFAELLRHRLQLAKIDTVPLHRRAGEWFQNQGLLDESIPHFLAARAWEPAAAVLEEASEYVLSRGEAVVLQGWLSQLPPGIIDERPSLALQYAWALIMTGRLDAAEPYLNKLPEQVPLSPEFLSQVLTAQAYLARMRYNGPRTIQLSQQALALMPDEQVSRRAVLGLNLGIAYWHAGQVREAEKALTAARFAAEQAGNYYVRDMAVGFLAAAQGTQGKLVLAADMVEQALATGPKTPTTALAHRMLAAFLYEWNHLEAAEAHLVQADTGAQAIGNVELLGGVLRGIALLKQAQGDSIGVAQSLARLHALTEQHKMPPFTHSCNAAIHVQIALAKGDLATAVHWASQITEPADGSPFFPRLNLTPARLLLAQGEKAAAIEALDTLYEQARQGNWIWGMVEVRLLQALAATGAGEAQAFLCDALVLGESARLVRTFLDKGAPMVDLLQQALNQNPQARYAAQLLSHYQVDELGAVPPDQDPMAGNLLVDPLSEREVQILQLLARHQTNAEIGQALVVSVNTVKTHLKHIYEKLGVHDRKTAVAQAHELNLFPTETHFLS